MMDINSFSDHINFLKIEIDKALRKIPVKDSPKYLYDPIQYVISGKGKRLRPILVHLSGQAHDADPSELMKVSLAVELLHNFSLVHDDIMDGDEIRHSKPSVHHKWDNSAAILAGDGLFSLAQLLLTKLPIIVFQRFNEVALTICEGQGMDKEFENNSSININHYLSMIGKKTGALLGLSAEMGVLLGKLDNHKNKDLFEFGFNLGLAFQIQDDYLEIFGDESSMGKSLGSDITSGKQTVLTILAREKDPVSWDKFVSSNSDIQGYKEYYESSEVKVEAKKLIDEFISKSQINLDVVPKEKRDALKSFSQLILNRKF
jgi:geranylgeranyl pyrophosphate synthase